MGERAAGRTPPGDEPVPRRSRENWPRSRRAKALAACLPSLLFRLGEFVHRFALSTIGSGKMLKRTIYLGLALAAFGSSNIFTPHPVRAATLDTPQAIDLITSTADRICNV